MIIDLDYYKGTLGGTPVSEFAEIEWLLKNRFGDDSPRTLSQQVQWLLDKERSPYKQEELQNEIYKLRGVVKAQEQALAHWRKEADNDAGKIARLEKELKEERAKQPSSTEAVRDYLKSIGFDFTVDGTLVYSNGLGRGSAAMDSALHSTK